jgi:hypothetical protein
MEDLTPPQIPVHRLVLRQQHQLQEALVAVQQLEQDRLDRQCRQQALAEAALEAHLNRPQQ